MRQLLNRLLGLLNWQECNDRLTGTAFALDIRGWSGKFKYMREDLNNPDPLNPRLHYLLWKRGFFSTHVHTVPISPPPGL